MYRLTRNYYQIYRVDHKRNQEQMVAEVIGSLFGFRLALASAPFRYG